MTVGFPDWSRTNMMGGQQLGSFFGQKGSDPTTGIMDCIGFSFLTVQIGDQGNTHYFSVIVTWYSDQGGTNIVNTSQIMPVPGSNLSYQVPLASRYARVTESHIVFGDTESVGCVVFGSNVSTEQVSGPQGGTPFMSFGGSIPASSSVTVNPLYTYWGMASCSFSVDSGTKWYADLNFYDFATASFQTLANFNLEISLRDQTALICLPPCPVQLVVHNADTVAHVTRATICTA